MDSTKLSVLIAQLCRALDNEHEENYSEWDAGKIAKNIRRHPQQCSVRSSCNTGGDPLSIPGALTRELSALVLIEGFLHRSGRSARRRGSGTLK